MVEGGSRDGIHRRKVVKRRLSRIPVAAAIFGASQVAEVVAAEVELALG